MIFLSVSKPQGIVWLEGALELSRMAGHESRVTHSERVPSPGRSRLGLLGSQKSSANYTVYSQQLVTSGFIFQKYRYIARKRRRFKTTQNTFDKMWRRLPADLEYKFLEDNLDIHWSTSKPNLRPLHPRSSRRLHLILSASHCICVTFQQSI